MRAFVTGGTGFLGRRVVRRLVDRGDEVLALARPGSRSEELTASGATVVEGDLGDVGPILDRVATCDVVYHVGARVQSHGDWDEFFRVNVEATQRLMDAALDGAARRFVHVSSLGIFEIDRDGMTITDAGDYDRRPTMRGFYTRSKIDADRIACGAARAGRNVVVVRPGLLYGNGHPQQPVFLGRVRRFLRPDLLVVVSTPGYLLPLAYVENAADAVVLAGVTEGIDGSSFNVIDDPDLTQGDYFRILGQVRERSLRVVYVPVWALAPAVRAVDAVHRLVRRRPWSVAYQLLRSERSTRYAIDAATGALGWKPRVGLRQALEESLGKSA